MGRKSLLALAFILLASRAHAAPPPRPPEDADLEDIRAYRIAVKKERLAVRDSARREDNLVISVAPFFCTFNQGWNTEPTAKEDLVSLAFSLGYRTHFKNKLGIKAGAQFFTAETQITQYFHVPYAPGTSDYYGDGYEYSSSGSAGKTYGVNASAQAILGPFGRFALEPGLGVSWGGHTVDTVALSGDAGDRIFVQRSHFSYYSVILGGALYLGGRDEFSISPSLSMGYQPGASGSTMFQGGVALGYAIQLPKRQRR